MNVSPTEIPDVKIIEPKVFGDDRGFFFESWNARTFEAAGIADQFVQDNHSQSVKGVLRGLHYQLQQPQGKLVQVLRGKVFDVAVDLRQGSDTFGNSVCIELSDVNRRQIWIPEGFAHGFLVLSNRADVLYKTTDFYHPESEQFMQWNDPALGIEWPLDEVDNNILLSAKDKNAKALSQLMQEGLC